MTYRDYTGVDFTKAVLVPLMPPEVARIRQHAENVRQEATAKHRTHRHAWQPTKEEENKHQLIGWVGELAVAKFLGVAYHYADTYDPARYDVAGQEVRSTEHFNGHLITYPDDKPGAYTLALVHRISFDKFDVVLAGCINLTEANSSQHWRTDRRAPAYFTPQHRLHPMATLNRHRQKAALHGMATH